MAYTFDAIFAVDPNAPSNVARNATITIFDPADTNQAPVTITDPTGSPLPNPITVDAAGMGPAFQHPTLARVGWKGAGFVGYFTSYEGMFNETKAAKEAAQAAVTTAATAGSNAAAAASAALAEAVADAEAASVAASNAAALVGAPADTAIAAAVSGNGATRTALNTTIAAATASKVDKASLRDWQALSARNSIALRRWRLALGGRATAPADVYFMGDSITAGYTVSRAVDRWGYRLSEALRQRYPVTGVVGGFGFLSPRNLTNSSGNYTDNPVTFVGGSQAGYPGFGLDLNARVLSGSGNTITWAFTGTGFDIDYTKYSGGGSFSWAVDGGAATTVATANATLDTGSGTVQIRGLSAASHTVTIAWVSGSSYINGGFAYNGDETKGIRSTIMATLGWSSASWWPANSAQRYWPASIAKRSPDLVFIALGANDFGTSTPVSVAAYKANLKAIIAAFKANVTGYVPSFVLLPYWTIGTSYTPLAPYADYVTAQYEVAAEDTDSAVAIFDFQQRINPGAPSTVGGFLPDTTHPVNEGNQAMADMLVEFLATA